MIGNIASGGKPPAPSALQSGLSAPQRRERRSPRTTDLEPSQIGARRSTTTPWGQPQRRSSKKDLLRADGDGTGRSTHAHQVLFAEYARSYIAINRQAEPDDLARSRLGCGLGLVRVHATFCRHVDPFIKGIISKVTPTPVTRYGSVQAVLAHYKESRYDLRRGGPAGTGSDRGADYPPTHRLTGRRGTFRYNPQAKGSKHG